MTEELKPCPFCGGKATISKDAISSIVTWYMPHCTNKRCHACVQAQQSIQDAITTWNTRAELTCKGCKHEKRKMEHHGLNIPCHECTHVNYNDCYEVVDE